MVGVDVVSGGTGERDGGSGAVAGAPCRRLWVGEKWQRRVHGVPNVGAGEPGSGLPRIEPHDPGDEIELCNRDQAPVEAADHEKCGGEHVELFIRILLPYKLCSGFVPRHVYCVKILYNVCSRK